MDAADPEVKSNTRVSQTQKTSIKVNINNDIKYPIQELIENSKALTGCGKEVAVGALFNCEEKELTKEDFKKLIKIFLGKKVK